MLKVLLLIDLYGVILHLSCYDERHFYWRCHLGWGEASLYAALYPLLVEGGVAEGMFTLVCLGDCVDVIR